MEFSPDSMAPFYIGPVYPVLASSSVAFSCSPGGPKLTCLVLNKELKLLRSRPCQSLACFNRDTNTANFAHA